jgi:hypothetical protein
MEAVHERIAGAHPTNAIWNPNAAANWSILFTPVFGSYLQRQNWEALGELELAAWTRKWFYMSIGVIVFLVCLNLLFPGSEAVALSVKAIAILYLVTWYYSCARPQAKYVSERFGEDYPHRRWGKPLLYALGFTIAWIAFAVVLGILAGIAR